GRRRQDGARPALSGAPRPNPPKSARASGLFSWRRAARRRKIVYFPALPDHRLASFGRLADN
ncbi:hypothetical protein, partial [Burkholderia sp. Cy-647]